MHVNGSFNTDVNIVLWEEVGGMDTDIWLCQHFNYLPFQIFTGATNSLMQY